MGKYVDITFKDKTWLLNGSVETYNCKPSERCDECMGDGRCTSCNGQGEFRCKECGGRGIKRCGSCGGGGICYHCKGRGVVEETNGWISECVFCHGSGACNSCKGSGTYDCYDCNGTGFVTCSSCRGDGRCGNCGGSGKITCKRCQGSGFYQQYVNYTSQYCIRQFFFPGLKPELTEGLRLANGKELYKAVCKLWRNKDSVAFDDTAQCLQQFCDSFGKNDTLSETFKKEYESVPELNDNIPGYMPYKNTLTSYKTRVTKIVYEINGQEYAMYLLGDNGVVCYDNFPQKVNVFDISEEDREANKRFAYKRHKELALLTAYIFNLDGISPKESKSLSLILKHMGLNEKEREKEIKNLTSKYTPEVSFETILSKTKHLLKSKKTISYVWQCIAIDNEITPQEQAFFDKLVSCYNISESELNELKRFSSKFAAMDDSVFVEEYLDSGPVSSKKGIIFFTIAILVSSLIVLFYHHLTTGGQNNEPVPWFNDDFSVESPLPVEDAEEVNWNEIDVAEQGQQNKLKGYEWLEGVWAGGDYDSFGRMIVTDSYIQVVNSNMDDASDNVEDMPKEDYELKTRQNEYDGYNDDGEVFGFNDFIGVDVEKRCIYIIQGEYNAITLHKINTSSFESAVYEANHNYPTENIQDEPYETYQQNNSNKSRFVVIDGSELRLRFGPSTSYDTFKWPDGTNRHPNVGDRFKYLGESGDFFKIDFNGNELWVSKQFSHIEESSAYTNPQSSDSKPTLQSISTETTTGKSTAQAETKYTEVSCIKVSGNAWFVLDHQYSDSETIHIERATFGLYGATGNETKHQQLLSGGDGELLRIGQRSMYETSYGYVYFNLGQKLNTEYEYQYGHVTSKADGYILNKADVVLSPSNLYINRELITSYSARHLNLSTNMCLFANNKKGDDVVHNQTATLGTITITNNQGKVTAKYTPMLDSYGRPCFYNNISGSFIYHTGSGTPDYEP